MKTVMIALIVLAICFLGYDVWYLLEGKSGEHIPFLFTGVLVFFVFCIHIAKDLPQGR